VGKRRFCTVSVIFLLFAAAFGASGAQNQKPKVHHADAGLTCADCHETDTPSKGTEEPKCLECHESRDAVAERTKEQDPNPHFGHEDGLSCNRCHKEHETSILFCDDCHQWGYTTP
jgi:fumarate reductase flavoprotein subunit